MTSGDLLLAGPRATLKLGAVALRLGTAPARGTIRLGVLIVEDLLDAVSPQAVPGKVLRPEPAGTEPGAGRALWPGRGDAGSPAPVRPRPRVRRPVQPPAEPRVPPAGDVAAPAETPGEAPAPAPTRGTQPSPPRAEPPAQPDAATPLGRPDAPVSEEPELVAESADPAAAEGAGAQVRVGAPWAGYGRMRAAEIRDRLVTQSEAELAVLLLYERSHRARSSVIAAAEAELTRRAGTAPQGG
jgi:hypothetical protein